MRKEIMWVAGVGIILGLIFAFGVYRVNSLFPKKIVETKSSPNPNAQTQEFKITLAKPENKDVITKDSTIVTGLTKPGAFIAISGETADYITESDAKGEFEEEVDLTGGVNQIKITAFDKTGAQSATGVLVVYSSSFQEKTIPTPQASSTEESDIRAKVQEKVAQALNHPKAYIGTVTDIADSTIQIKSDTSQIEQISTDSEDISVVNSTAATAKTVKLTDIAIGDFIVAMGYINSNSVLSAQRVLIVKPITEPKLNTSMGKVIKTTTKNLTVTRSKSGEEDILTPDKNTDYYAYSEAKLSSVKFGSISEDDTVIYVLDTSKASPVVRSVFKI